MEILRFAIGDLLVMKKKHPCDSDRFRVLRTGSDVRIRCEGCGRDMTFSRVALEKMIRKVEAAEDKGQNG
ncbi:MAG: DUF951 domain-containing protein [Clostridia bacterium]|nr:DUF951 domain-containing protein [Clostridia bacterium]